MSDDDKREPIKAPDAHQKREGVRAIVEAVASFEPVTAALTRIYQTTHPPKSETDRQLWQEAVSERTNENTDCIERHEDLLNPKKTITGVAAALAQTLIQKCPDGLGLIHYEIDDLCDMLPDHNREEIENAAHELGVFCILSMRHHLNGWSASIAPFAYEQLDKQVLGWNTAEDAAHIAQLMLEHKTGHAPELEELAGWERRRFNPAFRVVIGLFPEGRVRQVIQADYPSLGVLIAPEDRVRLKRFVEKQPRRDS